MSPPAALRAAGAEPAARRRAAGAAHVARRLPVFGAVSGWNALLPPLPPATPLRAQVKADCVVVGAGYAGLSAAHRLLELAPGARVALLEAGRVAEGAAGRNSGFMIDLPHDLASDDYAGQDAGADLDQTRANRHAIAWATAFAAGAGLERRVFDPCGKINAAAGAGGRRMNRAYAAHLARMGEPCEWLDRAAMRELTGIDYYDSGLYTPGTVVIQPAAYIRALAARLGPTVSLYEQSPVTRLERAGGDWRVVTAHGAVSAPRVILAVNGHAESFGFFERRLMHVFTYASMTRALSPAEAARLGGRPRWAMTPADPMGVTLRRVDGPGGDRLLLRSRFTYDPSMRVDERRLAAIERLHRRQFRARFPMLYGVAMEYRWGGQLCLSRNGVAAFGEVDDGLFAACCQNGLGIARGTLSGLAAAELASGASSPLADLLGAAPPPARLPPEPLAWLGINGAIRYKEWRAGREF